MKSPENCQLSKTLNGDKTYFDALHCFASKFRFQVPDSYEIVHNINFVCPMRFSRFILIRNAKTQTYMQAKDLKD